MTRLQVGGLSFTFPEAWHADKYDDWAFYRNHFGRQFNGIQAVDLLARSPDGTAYVIEVKDYRHPDTAKPSELPQTIANKVLFTLAAMLPAKLGANASDERALAERILSCRKLRVVAHLELPRSHRQIVNPADLKQKLAQLLRAVDAHPKVVSRDNMHGLAWTVA